MASSKIEWTECTWNPVTGCTKISSGCANCYAERLAELAPLLNWPDNVWIGVTVENSDCAFRIDHLRKVPAAVRFLSMEPLLSAVEDMNLDNIDWVIVGGESGPGSRPIEKDWVNDILRQCRNADVAFFFKQWGGVNKKKAGRLLDGRVYGEMPRLRTNQFV